MQSSSCTNLSGCSSRFQFLLPRFWGFGPATCNSGPGSGKVSPNQYDSYSRSPPPPPPALWSALPQSAVVLHCLSVFLQFNPLKLIRSHPPPPQPRHFFSSLTGARGAMLGIGRSLPPAGAVEGPGSAFCIAWLICSPKPVSRSASKSTSTPPRPAPPPAPSTALRRYKLQPPQVGAEELGSAAVSWEGVPSFLYAANLIC